MKQTAVEIAFEKLANQGLLITKDYKNLVVYKQAKEMEREQIIKSAQDNFYAGQDLANGYKIDWKSAEDYYNKTFKSE